MPPSSHIRFQRQLPLSYEDSREIFGLLSSNITQLHALNKPFDYEEIATLKPHLEIAKFGSRLAIEASLDSWDTLQLRMIHGKTEFDPVDIGLNILSPISNESQKKVGSYLGRMGYLLGSAELTSLSSDKDTFPTAKKIFQTLQKAVVDRSPAYRQSKEFHFSRFNLDSHGYTEDTRLRLGTTFERHTTKKPSSKETMYAIWSSPTDVDDKRVMVTRFITTQPKLELADLHIALGSNHPRASEFIHDKTRDEDVVLSVIKSLRSLTTTMEP